MRKRGNKKKRKKPSPDSALQLSQERAGIGQGQSGRATVRGLSQQEGNRGTFSCLHKTVQTLVGSPVQVGVGVWGAHAFTPCIDRRWDVPDSL